MTTISTLRDLFDALKSLDEARRHPERFGLHDAADAEVAFCRSVGLPVAHGECDWSGLPTFGGVDIEDTSGVWSWDATHQIVGTCPADIEIVAR